MRDPLGKPRILVVGDVMLDRYLWGTVDRISPEAPVPVLRAVRQEHRLGGAGAVAAMVQALEGHAWLAGAVGDDAEGAVARQLANEAGIEVTLLVTAAGRPTTLKERVLGLAHSRHPQQMLRIDREDDRPLPEQEAEALLAGIGGRLEERHLVLASDYAKGVFAGNFVPRLVDLAAQASVRVLADPARGADYRGYAGCECITPNRLEAGAAVGGVTIRTPEDGLAAAERLLEFGVQNAVVTLDRDGMAWASADGRRGLFPVRAREVYDITGAGDMVLAALGVFLAAGCDYPRAIELANAAGGLEVERLGVAPITKHELLSEAGLPGARRTKLVALPELEAELLARQRAGQRIAMTNGCFDLLHPGHVASLEAARRLGDCLVVGLNSDCGVRQLKGPARPFIDEQGRAAMLAALACVDYVVLFDEPSVAALVAQVRPDVLAKSEEHAAEEVVGGESVKQAGGAVKLTPLAPGYSTTGLVQKIAETERNGRGP